MSKRYWLPLITALGLLAGHVQADSVSHSNSRKASAQQSQPQPRADAPLNIPAAVQNDVHSIASALEAANNRKPSDTDERNAKAQERVADWAPWMFGVAALESLVTLTGVFLVWRTLKATWNAANHAKRAADAAEASLAGLERPHLFIQNPRLEQHTEATLYNRSGIRRTNIFEASFDIANYGRSPAIITRSSATIFIGEKLPDIPEIPAGDVFTEVRTPIGADKTMPDWRGFWRRGTLTDEIAVKLQEGRTALDMGYRAYLFVQLRYDSVVGKTDEIGDIWEYLIDVHAWVPRQVPNYSYRKLGQ